MNVSSIDVAPSVAYGILSQTHPTYAAAEWGELNDLYVGGYQIARNAARYLPKYVGEDHRRYAERVTSVAYLNYLGSIADHLVAHLFARELRVTPAADAADESTVGDEPFADGFWDQFAANADRRGNTLATLLRKSATTALVKGRALVGCDMPAVIDRPVTRAHEDAIGAGRGYAFEIPIESLLDWEKDDTGLYAWAILHSSSASRPSPASPRGGLVEEFKVWSLVGGFARWDTYRTKERPASERLDSHTQVPWVQGGTTSFRSIPVVEIAVPDGLNVGNKIGPIAKEHYQRRSALVAAENKSLFAIPVMKRGPEMAAPGSAMPSDAQQDPHRGEDPVAQFLASGFTVIGKDDSIEFAEPGGGAYSIVDGQLKGLVDEMYRVVHQMAQSVSSTSSAVGRSGDSKSLDQRTTEIILAALGQIFRDAARAIYTVLSEARGEDVVWTPHGLDNYSEEDRDALVDEAVKSTAITIPSMTFKKMYLSRVATALLGPVEPNTLIAIQNEIEVGVMAADCDAKAAKEIAESMPATPNAPQQPGKQFAQRA